VGVLEGVVGIVRVSWFRGGLCLSGGLRSCVWIGGGWWWWGSRDCGWLMGEGDMGEGGGWGVVFAGVLGVGGG